MHIPPSGSSIIFISTTHCSKIVKPEHKGMTSCTTQYYSSNSTIHKYNRPRFNTNRHTTLIASTDHPKHQDHHSWHTRLFSCRYKMSLGMSLTIHLYWIQSTTPISSISNHIESLLKRSSLCSIIKFISWSTTYKSRTWKPQNRSSKASQYDRKNRCDTSNSYRSFIH